MPVQPVNKPYFIPLVYKKEGKDLSDLSLLGLQTQHTHLAFVSPNFEEDMYKSLQKEA